MPGLYVPKPSVPFVNPRTGLVSDEWYRLLLDLNTALATVSAVIGGLTFADISGTLTAAQAVAVPIDTLGPATDTTNLNATALAHGLLPKLSGNAAHRLGGDGLWH